MGGRASVEQFNKTTNACPAAHPTDPVNLRHHPVIHERTGQPERPLPKLSSGGGATGLDLSTCSRSDLRTSVSGGVLMAALSFPVALTVRQTEPCAWLASYRGNANVIRTSLLPNTSPSPPAAIATYWRPSAPR